MSDFEKGNLRLSAVLSSLAWITGKSAFSGIPATQNSPRASPATTPLGRPPEMGATL